MPVITQLTAQVKDPSRYNLYIDGAFYCGIDEAVALKYKLKVGLEIGQIELEQILQESELNKVYARVLDFIARRPRSICEVREYIIKKVHTYKLTALEEGPTAVEQVVNSLVQRLVRLKYVDDEEFAKWWIDQRVNAAKPRSLMAIVTELRKKGIDSDLVKQVWVSMGINTQSVLSQYSQKLINRYDLHEKKDRDRLVRHLLARGFRWEEIKSVLQLPPK